MHSFKLAQHLQRTCFNPKATGLKTDKMGVDLWNDAPAGELHSLLPVQPITDVLSATNGDGWKPDDSAATNGGGWVPDEAGGTAAGNGGDTFGPDNISKHAHDNGCRM